MANSSMMVPRKADALSENSTNKAGTIRINWNLHPQICYESFVPSKWSGCFKTRTENKDFWQLRSKSKLMLAAINVMTLLHS